MMVRQPRRALFGIVYKLLPLAYSSVPLTRTSSDAYTGKVLTNCTATPGGITVQIASSLQSYHSGEVLRSAEVCSEDGTRGKKSKPLRSSTASMLVMKEVYFSPEWDSLVKR